MLKIENCRSEGSAGGQQAAAACAAFGRSGQPAADVRVLERFVEFPRERTLKVRGAAGRKLVTLAGTGQQRDFAHDEGERPDE